MIRTLTALFTTTLLAQTLTAPAIPVGSSELLTVVSQLERVTLVGALIVAVLVLWKKLEKKDAQVIAAQTAVTEALITATEAQKSLQHTIGELNEKIARLPCTAETSNIAQLAKSGWRPHEDH